MDERVGAGLLLLAVLLGPVAAQDSVETPGGLDAALDTLDRERARHEPLPTRLEAAVREVRAQARALDQASVERLVAELCSREPSRARRAQTLLSQVPLVTLPSRWRESGSATLDAAAYAALRSPEVAPVTTMGRALIDRAGQRVQDLGRILGERLALSDGDLQQRNPEFAEDYRRECLPRLQNVWRYVRDEDCRWVDLDGDRSPELLIACDGLWRTSWIHDLAFVAVASGLVEGELRVSLWRVQGESIARVSVVDTDRDGSSEALVWVDVQGGRAASSALLLISRHGLTRLESCGPSKGVRAISIGGELMVSVQADPDWTLPMGGAAVERCGSLARAVELHRIRAGLAEQVATLWLPLDE